MNLHSLLKNANISVAYTLIAAASNTDQKTAVLDMAGYDGVVFITPITVETNTGVATLDVHGNSANSTSGSALITGATDTGTSTGSNLAGKALVVDVYKPSQRYVMGRIRSATANMTFGPTIAVRYRAKKRPVTNDSTVPSGGILVQG